MAGGGVLSGLDGGLSFLTVSTASQLPFHGGAVDGRIDLGDKVFIEVFFFCHGADFLQDGVPAAGLQDGEAAALLDAAYGLGDAHALSQQLRQHGADLLQKVAAHTTRQIRQMKIRGFFSGFFDLWNFFFFTLRNENFM